MARDCLTQFDVLALLAGDASPDDWREHADSCGQCRRIIEREVTPMQQALQTGFRTTVTSDRVAAGREGVRAALRAAARPIAHYSAWRESPVGPMYLAVSGGKLCALSFGGGEEAFVRRLVARGFEPLPETDATGPALSQLREYFGGRRRAFEVEVDLAGQTPFQRDVLEATARVPAGSVVSYGDIARAIGRPRATRAVGAALGQNPVPIVVPCHRVIGSDGGLHGYGGGLEVKAMLLRLEGAPV